MHKHAGFFLAAILALALSHGFANAQTIAEKPAAQVALKDSSRLDGKIIYLGDLFSNLSETKREIAVAYTPAPGKRAVFDARWLYRVARSHKLKWRPLSRHDRIVIERTSTIINRDQIAEDVLSALLDEGADPDMEVEFGNRNLRLHVGGDELAVLGIDDAIFDARSLRFSAIIHAPAGDPAAKRVRITGRLHRTSEVPVPVRRILAGEVIRKEDLKWIKVRSRRLQRDIVHSDLDMIGMSPRRGLRTGQPIRTSAVRRPILVKKGSLVTIILNAPKMRLTAQGKANADGGEGDVIQIMNTQSKSVVEAEVIGPGRVTVRMTTQLAMTQQ